MNVDEEILQIEKELKELELANDSSNTNAPEGKPAIEIQQDKKDDVNTSKDKQEQPQVKKEEWKDGYLEYEVKNKESERVSYNEDEIEIIEEDV